MSRPRKYASLREAREAKRAQAREWARRNSDWLRECRKQKRVLKKNPRWQPSHEPVKNERSPDDVLTDRKRRQDIERTPNNLILGDPLPGYSALDRR